MKRILYLGNKFYSYKKVRSVLETLEPLFSEFSYIKTASNKENQFLRFFDLFYFFIRYGIKADRIIIDVYSTRAFHFAYIFSLLSKFSRKKYILFLHGGNLPLRYENSPKKIVRIFDHAHKIVAPSPYLQSFFQEKDFNIEYIPNIIEIEKYTFSLRKDIRPNLLAIRGFGKPYNPLMTLRSVNELKKTIPKLKLLMLGNKDEYYYKEVKDYIENNKMQEFVFVHDKCTRDEWVELSINYDIMISNPFIDNTPVSLIEGMALGMCIVCTNVGGIPFLIEDRKHGILINNDSSDDLVTAINNLLNDPDLVVSLSQNGREKAEKHSWNLIKSQWLNLINS